VECQSLSRRRRRAHQQERRRRQAEETVRQRVATVCHYVQTQDVPMIQVTRYLAVSDRTVRRWRSRSCSSPMAGPDARGRPPQPATRADRNGVYQFLRERGADTPLTAVQAAFPHLRRSDLSEILRRYRRVIRRQSERHQSRLAWLRAGAVWAADFKERREPIEGCYAWILAVKDLASRCQLAWLPVEEATAQTVQAVYAQLFAEHGPPLVLKSDNGGPFRDEGTKQLLAAQLVAPLYNPRRRPAYNGGVERANGQLAGYQEALAAFRGHAGAPTCEDAASARNLANELAHPEGWQGPTAGQLWQRRAGLSDRERDAFLMELAERRAQARCDLHLPPEEPLAHYPQAAVDRRAVRDTLVSQGLLAIQPKRRKPGAPGSSPGSQTPLLAKNLTLVALDTSGAGRIADASTSARPTTSAALAPELNVELPGIQPHEEAHSSTNKSTASGQD
jgi:transposase InsO family protein